MTANITEITVLTAPKSQTDFFLQVPSFVYFKMLMHACMEVLSTCSPYAQRYLNPDDGVPDVFQPQTSKFRRLMTTFDMPHYNSQITYLAFHSQVHYILAYVEYRNSDREKYFVGMESYTNSMVYAAVVAFHNWKAKALEGQIKRDGPVFGSALGWFTINHANDVRDWPERYGFPTLEIDLLPIENPNYQHRCEEYMVLKALPDATGYVVLKSGRVVKIWSNNPDDRTLDVHEKGGDFEAEHHSTFCVSYDDVKSIGTV